MPTMLLNGQAIHYLDVGEGEPLLFGHGYLWDSRMWMPQLNLLSQYYRCIVPDLWGHGRSAPGVSERLDIEGLAADHYRLMQQLGCEQYGVVGFAVGGMWGARLAMDYPQSVSRLVMLGSCLGAEPAESAEEYAHLLDIVQQMAEIPPAIINAVVRIFFSRFAEERHPALVETFRFDLMTLAPEQVASIVTLGEAMLQRDSLLARLGEIRCPTLILAGEHDMARPVAESETMHAQLPGSQFAVIEKAGHMMNLEQPDQVNQRLLRFLCEVDDLDLNVDDLVFI